MSWWNRSPWSSLSTPIYIILCISVRDLQKLVLFSKSGHTDFGLYDIKYSVPKIVDYYRLQALQEFSISNYHKENPHSFCRMSTGVLIQSWQEGTVCTKIFIWWLLGIKTKQSSRTTFIHRLTRYSIQFFKFSLKNRLTYSCIFYVHCEFREQVREKQPMLSL